MKLLVFTWSVETIVGLGVLGIMFLVILLAVLKYIFDWLFKQNCRKCKHCKLHSVAAYGDGKTYRCDIDSKKRYIYIHDTGFIKCKEYEE